MGQVAVGIWEVRLQLQRGPVRLDGLGDVSGILVHRREVGVSVRKRGIDLNGPGVALQRALNVVHLLQGVAHVAVGIGEGRLDPDCLLVVHQSLVQLALLLQDGGQVGVGCRELWEDLKSLQVEPGGLFDVALLALDVGQIVQRIGVRRVQPGTDISSWSVGSIKNSKG